MVIARNGLYPSLWSYVLLRWATTHRLGISPFQGFDIWVAMKSVSPLAAVPRERCTEWSRSAAIRPLTHGRWGSAPNPEPQDSLPAAGRCVPCDCRLQETFGLSSHAGQMTGLELAGEAEADEVVPERRLAMATTSGTTTLRVAVPTTATNHAVIA